MSSIRRLALAVAATTVLCGVATPASAQSSAPALPSEITAAAPVPFAGSTAPRFELSSLLPKFPAKLYSQATGVSSDWTSTVSGWMGEPNPLDELGRPTPQTQARVIAFAEQPGIPSEVRDAILSAVAFYAGTGESGGVDLVEGGPNFSQFYWPTVSGSCIGGQGNSVGSAIAVPGPTEIPAPGASAEEAVFLFTALGTAPAAERQGGMQVQWFNLNTLASGTTQLVNNGINPDGPATVSGTARTGKGTIVAVLSGTVNTQEQACRFLPTAAIFEVK